MAILCVTLALIFGLLYRQITLYEDLRVDRYLSREALSLAGLSKGALLRQIELGRDLDLGLVVSATALFDNRHHPLAGPLKSWPTGLREDGSVVVTQITPDGREAHYVRAIALRLANGEFLVVARDIHDLRSLRIILLRAFRDCAIPAIALAVAGGILSGRRVLARVGRMHTAIERIMAGDLHERLPISGANDELERLGGSVNGMLDRLESLVDEIKGAGDNIAHDLRTPLTKVRSVLERSLTVPFSEESAQDTVETALQGLNQCFRIMNALLRIAEMDSGRRQAGFERCRLDDLVRDVAELYAPSAELRGVGLTLTVDPGQLDDHFEIMGDPALLVEAVANVIDNAIKFTPSGGQVTVDLTAAAYSTTLTVRDTGPGIRREDRDRIFVRFYRGDQSRNIPGVGLGLNLVAAICRLHAIELRLEEVAGCGASFTFRF